MQIESNHALGWETYMALTLGVPEPFPRRNYNPQ